ncbi:hypothetical protein BMS3Abin04_00807 [bacterium BMS3Abin04]|nr:hypothetical protein BMS3Abin04_00807 [bacterium BMS3Abin04]
MLGSKLKLFLLYLVLASLQLFAQFSPPLINDFRISEDNRTATFIQKDPALFYNENRGFLIVWEDYRLGDKSYFAQKFDSLGNKIGKNFQIASNYNLVFSNNSNFLNISKTSYYSNSGGSVSFYGSVYNGNSQKIKDNISLGFVVLPWCGTGYLGYGSAACKANSGFLFGLRNNGYLNLTKLDESGNVEYKYSFSDSLNNFFVLNFSLSSSKTTNLITWVSVLTNMIYGHPDTLGLFATIINDSKLTDSRTFSIKKYYTTETYNFLGLPPLTKTINLSDSTFLVFDLPQDSIKLNYRVLNINSNSLSPDSSINLLMGLRPEPNITYQVQKFEVSQIANNKFLVYCSVSKNYSKYYNTLLLFNVSGHLLAKYSDSTSSNIKFGRQLFMLSNEEFFTAKSYNNDVFITRNQLLLAVDSTKINDDLTGSNDIKPFITPVDETRYFVTWNNEIGTFGRIIDENGVAEGNQIRLEGKASLFLSGNRCVNIWKKKINGDSSSIGFTLYNNDWSVIRKDTFQLGDYYNIKASSLKLSDSTFAIITGKTYSAKLLLYNLNGQLIKQNILTDSQYSYFKNLFKNNNNSFWVKWGSHLRLFSNSLEAISEIYESEGTNYLGFNKFIKLYTHLGDYNNYFAGIILSAKGDTLVKEFKFENIPYTNQASLKIVPLKTSKFLILFSKRDSDGKLNSYWQVYHYDGTPEWGYHKIPSNNVMAAQNATATLNSDKIFFVWSDLQDGNLGYDIYGKIYNINSITGINSSENNNLPKEFRLYQNYPNPFNPTTIIKYSVTKKTHTFIPSREGKERSGRGVLVTLKVYDVLGRKIATLVNQKQSPGNYQVQFDANNLSSGIYFYRLKAGNFIATKKMILLR